MYLVDQLKINDWLSLCYSKAERCAVEPLFLPVKLAPGDAPVPCSVRVPHYPSEGFGLMWIF